MDSDKIVPEVPPEGEEEEDISDVDEHGEVESSKMQWENHRCRYLPYADELETESVEWLADIKKNLRDSIMLRDLDALDYWCSSLNTYINLYTLKFSLTDHLDFIRGLLAIYFIPEASVMRMKHIHRTIRSLIATNSHVLQPRKHLTIPWKSIFNICKKYLSLNIRMGHIHRYRRSVLKEAQYTCITFRCYIDASEIEDIMREIRPLFSPYDHNSTQSAFVYLCYLFPTYSLPEEYEAVKKAAVEILDFWMACPNSPRWDDLAMRFAAEFAHSNIGHFDWEPYLEAIFAKILRSFKLPINYKKITCPISYKLISNHAGTWVAAILDKSNNVQWHLSRLLKTAESCCYAANSGRYTIIIQNFLMAVVNEFTHRLKMERVWVNYSRNWMKPVPDDKKLSDHDVEEFVRSIQPILMNGLFSGIMNLSVIFHFLATLRPDIIIPPLIEKLYSSFDSVTEPFKQLAMINVMSAVARPMVRSCLAPYKEGITHVGPLLAGMLPGINGNDLPKSGVAMQFIMVMSHLVYYGDLVGNNSEVGNEEALHPSMTAEEEIATNMAGEFEDFVMKFLDRCFVLVESLDPSMYGTNDAQTTRNSSVTRNVGKMLWGLQVMLEHMSEEIFTAALQKTFTFATTRLFTAKNAGEIIGAILQHFSTVKGEETLKLVMPTLLGRLKAECGNADVQNAQLLDPQIEYDVVLLFCVASTADGSLLLPYLPELDALMEQIFSMKNKEIRGLAAEFLFMLVVSLSDMKLLEMRSLPNPSSKGDPPIGKVQVREWGKAWSLNNFPPKWYVPSKEVVQTLTRLVRKYITKELRRIDGYVKGEIAMTREDLDISIDIIGGMIQCRNMFPAWNGRRVKMFQNADSNVKMWPKVKGSSVEILAEDGSNILEAVVKSMIPLQAKLLAEVDDTKSMENLILVWGTILFGDLWNKESSCAFNSMLSVNYRYFFENPVKPKDKIRSSILHSLTRLHLIRSSLQPNFVTEEQIQALEQLTILCVNPYSKVRKTAQSILCLLPCCVQATLLEDFFLKNLAQDPEKNPELFKGVLHTLQQLSSGGIFTPLSGYEFLKKLLPALVRSKPSEKPSIIALRQKVLENIMGSVSAPSLNLEIPDEIVRWASNTYGHLGQVPSPEMVEEARLNFQRQLQRAREDHSELLSILLEDLRGGKLAVKHAKMALGFIRCLNHTENPYGPEVVKFVLESAINDALPVRSVALLMMSTTLFTVKTRFDKVERTFATMTNEDGVVQRRGEREDNEWRKYREETLPKSEEEWNEPRYVFNLYEGFYAWSVKTRVHTSPAAQPLHNEVTGTDGVIQDFFSDERNVDKFMGFMSVEEKRKKQAASIKENYWQYVFRCCGYKFVHLFRKHLETLIVSQQPAAQRCAAHIIFGIIRGSRMWPYKEASELYEWLAPLVVKGLENSIAETQLDWLTSMIAALYRNELQKCHPIVKALLNDFLKENVSSMATCARMSALQAVFQHTWLVCDMARDCLEYIKPHMSSPYQNVRLTIATVLLVIFRTDLEAPDIFNPTSGPRVGEFVDNYVVPKLETLREMAESKRGVELQEACKEEILMLKTVAKWISVSCLLSPCGRKIHFFKLFPLLCYMESYDQDQELEKLCECAIAGLAYTHLSKEDIPDAVDAIFVVVKKPYWRVRNTVSEFVRIFAYYNMPYISSDAPLMERFINFILDGLRDERCEVRVQNGVTMSGFLHCDLVPNTIEFFLSLFTKWTLERNDLRVQHAGIIGLCSIINASPYSVPPHVPPIFVQLGDLVHGPTLFSTTIRKTLNDFKRTHQLDWELHKLKFTEDQLEVLTEMAAPPSYFA